MGPKPYKVYIFLNGKMRKVAEYERFVTYKRKIDSYASFPRKGKVYVTILGNWYRVVFREAGSREYPGWDLIESDGVKS